MISEKKLMLRFRPIDPLWMVIAIAAALIAAMALPALFFGRWFILGPFVGFVLVLGNFVYAYLLKMHKLDQNETEQSVNEYFMMNAQRFIAFVIVVTLVSVIFPVNKGAFFLATTAAYIVFILLDYLNMNQIEIDAPIEERKRRNMEEVLPYPNNNDKPNPDK